MKWIDPFEKYENKIKRCEFCNADVSTPYKGVHEETELILGIPVACRNNGRMNVDIAFPGIARSGPQPVENIKWFVEDPETHKWFNGYSWTSDPLEAFGCDLERTADRYARLKGIEKYIITEHEFVSL